MPRKKRHKPEQIIGKLRDADAVLAAGKTIGQVCQALEISEQTCLAGLPQMRPTCVGNLNSHSNLGF